jgi:hypothetical protein
MILPVAVSALAAVLFAATCALAQTPGAPPAAPATPPADVEIQTTPQAKPEGAKVVPPPLHYDRTRPSDAGNYGHDVRVEHDPAFIEPFTGDAEGSTWTAHYGVSGWTSPNTPVGPSTIGYRELNGYLGFGLSIVWGPAPPRPASLRPAAPSR